MISLNMSSPNQILPGTGRGTIHRRVNGGGGGVQGSEPLRQRFALPPPHPGEDHASAASKTAVLNSAMPLPVSLDVVKMAGCAAGCFAASLATPSYTAPSAEGF